MLYKIPDTKSNQLRLALTRTYKAPAVNNLTPRRLVALNNSPTEPDRIGNPTLQPELALGIDASYQHYWDEKSMLSVSVSTREIENYTRTALSFANGRWVGQPINDGDARTHSIELETRFPLRTFWKSGPALDLRASVSRNWSRVASVPGPDNRVEQQVPLSAQLALDYKTGAFTTGASFAFKDAVRARVAVDRWAYAWARRDLEAYVVWKAGPKLQWRAALSNILGEDEGSGIAYRDAAGNVEKRRWDYPGGPQLRVTMEVGF